MSCIEKILEELLGELRFLKSLPQKIFEIERRIAILEESRRKGDFLEKAGNENHIEPKEGDIIRGIKHHGFDVSDETLRIVFGISQNQIGAARAYLSGKLKKKLTRPIPSKKVIGNWVIKRNA